MCIAPKSCAVRLPYLAKIRSIEDLPSVSFRRMMCPYQPFSKTNRASHFTSPLVNIDHPPGRLYPRQNYRQKGIEQRMLSNHSTYSKLMGSYSSETYHSGLTTHIANDRINNSIPAVPVVYPSQRHPCPNTICSTVHLPPKLRCDTN